MKRLLLLLLLLALCAAPVLATRETLQDWSNSLTIIGTGTRYMVNSGSFNTFHLETGYGPIYLYMGNPSATPMDYSAATETVTHTSGGCSHGEGAITLYDSNFNVLYQYSDTLTCGGVPVGRYEVRMTGGQARIYRDGSYITQSGVLAVNPSYVYYGTYTPAYYYGYTEWDNLIMGETDHHVVGALPSNWTIIRDLTNPAAIGVYAWNPTTSAWVLKNSNNFYIDADTDSTDATTSETFTITNVQYGTIVNTTTIDSTVPRHRLTYNITVFLNTPTALGTAIPDGEYTACFSGSVVCENFWVISNGAAVATDKSSYLVGETAIVTTTMLPAYFDTATYDYTLKSVDVYGTTLSTQTINTATQTSTISMTQDGVQFLEVVATKKSDGTINILGYAAVTVYEYLGFRGTVYDGVTQLPLAGAAYNFTQGGTIVTGTSGFDGNYSVSTFGTGSVLQYNFTKSTYHAWNFSLTPQSTGYKTLDVSLYPLTASGSGTMLQGVVHDNVYGNIIGGATITLTDGSTSYSVTGNDKAWYLFDNSHGGPLTAGTCYFLGATKTGFLFASPIEPQCVVSA